MFRKFLLKNINLVAVILFIIFFALIIISKPRLIFDKNNKPRDFGIGYKNKTIFPLWLAIIVLAILSYFCILYYINLNKLIF